MLDPFSAEFRSALDDWITHEPECDEPKEEDGDGRYQMWREAQELRR